jgi:hypothetical protein
MAFNEDLRADGSAKAEFRSGLTLERATHLLLLLAGMDVYHVLVESHGWSHEEWVAWTVSAVAEQVFGRTAS